MRFGNLFFNSVYGHVCIINTTLLYLYLCLYVLLAVSNSFVTGRKSCFWASKSLQQQLASGSSLLYLLLNYASLEVIPAVEAMLVMVAAALSTTNSVLSNFQL